MSPQQRRMFILLVIGIITVLTIYLQIPLVIIAPLVLVSIILAIYITSETNADRRFREHKWWEHDEKVRMAQIYNKPPVSNFGYQRPPQTNPSYIPPTNPFANPPPSNPYL